jgi:hypothetical protein
VHSFVLSENEKLIYTLIKQISDLLPISGHHTMHLVFTRILRRSATLDRIVKLAKQGAVEAVAVAVAVGVAVAVPL